MRGRVIDGIRIGNVLACEFVRTEAENKFSILGAFSGDVLVPELPARFLIAFYIEVFFTKLGQTTITIAASHGSKPYSRVKAELEVSDLAAPAILAFPTLSVLIETEGTIDLTLEIGEKKHNILKKPVRVAPKPAG